MTAADTAGERAAYLDGEAWTSGPAVVYDRMAARALAGLPADLTGVRALDVGAGTGAATRELRRRGAAVTAVDMSTSMLAELSRQTAGQVPTMVGDICALPLPPAAYDVSVAAYVINHLEDPVLGVRELTRVTRPGGQVLATTFGADDHPIKPAIDAVLAAYGFVPPQWYLTLKLERMPLIATPEALVRVGRQAGLVDARVDAIDIDLSDLPWEAGVAYRLGLAHIAPFLRDLDPETRSALERDAVAAVSALPALRLPMLLLTGHPPK